MFEDLEQLVCKLGKERSFAPLGSFGERHGSWELTLYKASDGLERFVSVALTSLPAVRAEQGLSYELEVRAGAEEANRFLRRLISQLQISERELFHAAVRGRIEHSLRSGMEFADETRSTDLTESYLPTHSL